MRLFLEIVLRHGFLIELLGVAGLGLAAFAGLRIASHRWSTKARLISLGAVALMLGRLLALAFRPIALEGMPLPPAVLALWLHLPTLLLTAGLGIVVWGFWGHERRESGLDPS